MKQNYKIYLCALLLVGATGMMTAGAQDSGSKPTLAVFVVGMQTDALGDGLAQKIGDELNRNSRYTVLSSAADPVKAKLTELRTQGARSINRNALAEWGRTNGVSTICLVADDIKGSDNMFYAYLIDTKESKVSGRGNYVRTGVSTSELPRISLALAKQLEGPGRRHAAPAPTRNYPVELDIEMVFVEGGTFQMGCTAEQENDCNSDGREKPVHSVTVSSFWIGKYEVTRAQWIAVMAGTNLADAGSRKNDDQLPIETVSWENVQEFLTRLNNITGKSYRLPTEAEWEWAARGGQQSKGYKYSGGNDMNEVSWNLNIANRTTYAVGGKKPNELGIYDMSGNVFEWCSDWYDSYSNAAQQDPTGPLSGTNRVIRGGDGFLATSLGWLRVSARLSFNSPTYNVGFRVVLPAQ
jgi:formylglycine-generating enzyme required for sulfatase activity